MAPRPPALLRPVTLRPLALRWLLVLATLAGMGLWQGAHCPHGMVAAPASSASAAGVDEPGSVLAAEIDECEAVRAAAVSIGAGARMPLPSAGRTLAVTSPPQPVRTRPVPAVTLATIGVCRT